MPESTPLIAARVTFRPISVGQEKRSDGGRAQYQASGGRTPVRRGPACRGDPADGGRFDPWRAPAFGLRRGAAEPQPILQSVQFFTARSSARPGWTTAAAAGLR